MMQRIKIHTEKDDVIVPTHVYVGDSKIENVSHISLELGCDQAPVCNIECYGLPDNIDTIADVTITDVSDGKLLEIVKDRLIYGTDTDNFAKKLSSVVSEVYNIDKD
ncbi:MAG: hypothetical protein KBT03_01345 [Bacteroidales bacterium]|nr:hypothetical protein [Candidatus Scybalousia scybalohippi]